jgi:hypothetical protein
MKNTLPKPESKFPQILFHSSMYDAKVLMPGFNHTGVLVEWDGEENNHFLYATTDKESAIDLGFASAIEHKFQLDRFSSHGNILDIYTPQPISLLDLEKLQVYLYTILTQPNQGWIKNNNKQNNIETEYKTTERIVSFIKEKINIPQYLKGKKININVTDTKRNHVK